MKNILFISILVIHSTNIFGQSVIHPNKFGFGYHLGISNKSNSSTFSHNFYISTGKLDLMTSLAIVGNEESEQQVLSFTLSFTNAVINNKIFPSVNVSYTKISKTSIFGTGLSCTYEMLNNGNIRMLPKVGINYYSTGEYNYSSSVKLLKNVSSYAGISFAFEKDIRPVFVVTPEVQIGSKNTIYLVSIGISIAP